MTMKCLSNERLCLGHNRKETQSQSDSKLLLILFKHSLTLLMHNNTLLFRRLRLLFTGLCQHS
jgi:hypothetical protein